jgi:hypothetical protein
MSNLEKLVLQSHVVLRFKSNTSTEDVSQSTTLLSKSVDNRSSWWSQWSLEHVAENAENTVEALEVLGGDTIAGVCLPLNTGHHLGNDNKIDDQWRCKK